MMLVLNTGSWLSLRLIGTSLAAGWIYASSFIAHMDLSMPSVRTDLREILAVDAPMCISSKSVAFLSEDGVY